MFGSNRHSQSGCQGLSAAVLCTVLCSSLAGPPARGDLPAAYDWRTQVTFPPVRDQGPYNTGDAFGFIGVLEIALLRSGIEVDLSEQYLVNCGSGPGALGMLTCPDGIGAPPPNTCDQYGAPLEADLPYQGTAGPCACPYTMAYCARYAGTIFDDVPATKQALLDYGPLAAWVYAGDAFRAYSGGVFNSPADGSTNHMVMLIGWDDDDSGGVWLVRNSFGADWGEGGYMRIQYGIARIESQVAYLADPAAASCRLFGTVYGAVYGCGSPVPLAGIPIQGLGVTTDANGEYSAVVGYNTNWCIAPQNGAYFFMEDCRHINRVQGDTRSDFTGYVSQVSGRVTTADGVGVPEVVIDVQQVAASTVSTTTDADGCYSVIVGWGFTCTATPTKTNCTFDPPSRELGAVWECAGNQDFLATCAAPPVEEPNEPGGDTGEDATTADGQPTGDGDIPGTTTPGSPPSGSEEALTTTPPVRCGVGACGAGLTGPWMLTALIMLGSRRRWLAPRQ